MTDPPTSTECSKRAYLTTSTSTWTYQKGIWPHPQLIFSLVLNILYFSMTLHQLSESIRLSQMLLMTELHILHSAKASEGKINVQGAIPRGECSSHPHPWRHKYVCQFRQIHFEFSTNTFSNLDESWGEYLSHPPHPWRHKWNTLGSALLVWFHLQITNRK